MAENIKELRDHQQVYPQGPEKHYHIIGIEGYTVFGLLTCDWLQEMLLCCEGQQRIQHFHDKNKKHGR